MSLIQELPRLGVLIAAHVQSLRWARGLTQEQLAERSDLAVDTIRRLEHEPFSPGITTLAKLCVGLDLSLSTFFTALELCEKDITREVTDLLANRSTSDQIFALDLVRSALASLDQRIAEPRS